MTTDKLDLCRICLNTGAKLPLFEFSEEENCIILSKLNLCLNEKIEDIEGYPRNICKECNSALNTVWCFINKYKETCTILESGLIVVKDENFYSDHDGQSEVEIEINNVKTEPTIDYSFTNNDSDNQEESLPLMELKLKKNIKKENPKKIKEEKSLKIKAKSTKNDIDRIASSILEGDFAWIGDVWCIKPTKPVIQKKKKIPPQRQKIIKIVRPEKPKVPALPPPRLCDLCGEIFKDQEKLNLHKRKVHFKKSIKCPKCPRLLASQYYLNRHMKRRHENGSKNFICSKCGKRFAFKGELTTHNRSVHDKHLHPKKVFSCKLCNKTYKCAKSVIVHERSVHTGHRPAVCDICGTSFYHEDYLKEHRRLHTGETPFKCPICGRGYAQRCNMKSHIRIHRISEIDASTLNKLKPNYLKLLKVG